MKKIASLILVLVMVLGLAACATAQPENNEAPANNSQGESRFIHDITPTANSGGVERWEYMAVWFINSSTNDLSVEDHGYSMRGTIGFFIEKINEFGAEGWELITMGDSKYFFKRRLP
jgi:ABC-type glycerol-3-phosphate transport system substrate-binding protein